MALQVLDLVVLVIAAFLPSLLYVIWIRNTEKYLREPYSRILRVFVFGAVVSVAIALIVESLALNLIKTNLERVYQAFAQDPNLVTLLLAVVVAPVVEEMAKALGVFQVRGRMRDIEDGLIYGAVVGLGFAATENLLYESDALLTGGAQAFLATAVVRTFSSALLHSSASAVVGLGIARSAWQGKSWLPYYVVGVVMHASFNLAASFGSLYETNRGASAALIGLMAALTIAIVGITAVRAKIRALDQPVSPRGGIT